METAVFDTYVYRNGYNTMHFDVIVPKGVDLPQVLSYSARYLSSRNISPDLVNSSHCSFCHIEIPSPEVQRDITRQGYAIIELSGC